MSKSAKIESIRQQISELYDELDAIYSDPITMDELRKAAAEGTKVWVRYTDYGDEFGSRSTPRIDQETTVEAYGDLFIFPEVGSEASFKYTEEYDAAGNSLAVEYGEGEFAVFKV